MGAYRGALTCESVSCHDAPVPDHVNPPPPECKDMHYDKTEVSNKCTMTCDSCWSGPTAGTANTQVYSCDAESKKDVGHFEPLTKDALQCIAVLCEPLPQQDPNSVPTGWEGEKRCSEELIQIVTTAQSASLAGLAVRL